MSDLSNPQWVLSGNLSNPPWIHRVGYTPAAGDRFLRHGPWGSEIVTFKEKLPSPPYYEGIWEDVRGYRFLTPLLPECWIKL